MAPESLSPQKQSAETSTHDGRVPVLLPLPFAGAFEYRSAIALQPGDIVAVPLGRKDIFGCVWDRESTVPAYMAPPPVPPVDERRLKAVIRRLEVSPLPQELRHFIEWVAAYTLNPPGLVLATALKQHTQLPPKAVLGWVRTEKPLDDVRLTPARQSVLQALGDEPKSSAFLAHESGASTAVIRGLAGTGLIKEAPLLVGASFAQPQPDYAQPALSEEQEDVAQGLRSMVAAERFAVALLEGVTGSGKTEVYFEAVAACLRRGQQVLVLLPEIALSTQWTERFRRRFGVEPALWHSDLGQKRRRETWFAVADGSAKVIVGARSALFLPFETIGLIIVDEEHETSFKQEEGVTYHGRDMAVVRGRLAKAPVILVSATPSLETLANADAGRYQHFLLTSRHGGARLPDVTLLDLREDGPARGQFLAPRLCAAVKETLAAGEQAMLFLNRRGYAPLTLCRTCGHRMQCPNCTTWLVEHRNRGILTCHHCGHTEGIPKACPECDQEETLVPIGPGIERVTEEARECFPEARILVMSSDTLGSAAATAEAVRQITDGEVDLIIGTQIVAKGWHFPRLTLVGVVDSDLGLGGGDLRAAERTVQLLHQVAGRAGRAERPGRVMLQSYVTEHPVMEALASHDFEAFIEQETAQRKPGFWPPYGRLAALIISADSADVADSLAAEIARVAPVQDGIQVLGPAPAPLSVLRGRHRRRLLLKTVRGLAVQPIVRDWLSHVKAKGSARIDVDVDPISFL
ncbi:primosomal protein N' [Neokomagataea tanensis]|uniref:Replication restart protein PriA n=1 Tax=Neokomagataea tanensis TaxID=661191 RepID=A0A4Y6V4B7_9PROT|nr:MULTISPECIES: primosomal protein N' [Neokomagataea]QDH24909.1 primosomal protein N' [Neokomagataea tanensis]